MAVARIIAPKKWHERAAKILSDLPKAKAELLRAAERKGLTAELSSDEMRVLAERLPDDDLASLALAQLLAAEQAERNRPHPQDLVAVRKWYSKGRK